MFDRITEMYTASIAKAVFEVEVLRTNTSWCIGLLKDFRGRILCSALGFDFLIPGLKNFVGNLNLQLCVST